MEHFNLFIKYLFVLFLLFSCNENNTDKKKLNNSINQDGAIDSAGDVDLFEGYSINSDSIQDSIFQIILKTKDSCLFFNFSYLKSSGFIKYKLFYVGEIQCLGKIEVLQFNTKVGIYESSLHGGSHLIFFKNKKMIGSYNIMGDYYKPLKVENCTIKLEYDNDPECNRITLIDFNKEIPYVLFIECQGKYGNLFYFDSAPPHRQKVNINEKE